MVKNLPEMWEIQVWSLGRKNPLEKGTATHFSILRAWRIPWTEVPDGLLYMGLQRVRHDWAANTHTHTSFWIWIIFKVFIESLTILLLFYVLFFWPRGMWGLSSATRNQTHTSCTGRLSLNHWITREVPQRLSFICFIFLLCSRLIDHVCLFLGFLSCSVNLGIYSLCWYHIVLMNIAL